ncbi:nucleotidyl transferase AbiEii/AbiGii toxin family protein [Winogradskyella sediminis]|uniref:nucleotidyl transferase AbiEii/AbiGii toxin family protein n=1 Tax=Winogradskyella sediminis TaxID=1382466 RepID=UPI000E27C642|nr:nucleotidyl transferase AbiEii/AbiGii toxin family protein [Winogradskyella sediminis]REG87872.1 nucleotidyltransferase AbiEii toxin of type IV toxin-antitoxin system [Winogradskyella sediminis]
MPLYLNTVSDLLWESLNTLMTIEEFNSFRLVGGTSLSLQQGHRESIDIDLFTDAEYGSIDFNRLEEILNDVFPYVVTSSVGEVVFGRSYFVGEDENNALKLDIYYTDPFVFPLLEEGNIRLASNEEIAAMKFEVIANGGRKKDFWDIHELLDVFTLEQMLDFYEQRNPYGATTEELLTQCIDFSLAEDDLIPNCYKDKVWELIKLDIEEQVQNLTEDKD